MKLFLLPIVGRETFKSVFVQKIWNIPEKNGNLFDMM